MSDTIVDKNSVTWQNIEKWALQRIAAGHKDLETAAGTAILHTQGRVDAFRELLRMADQRRGN